MTTPVLPPMPTIHKMVPFVPARMLVTHVYPGGSLTPAKSKSDVAVFCFCSFMNVNDPHASMTAANISRRFIIMSR